MLARSGSVRFVAEAEQEAPTLAIAREGVVAELRRRGQEPAGLVTADATAARGELLLAEQAAAGE